MEAGFMGSRPSAIHVSILASPLHEDVPGAEPMDLENEVFFIKRRPDPAGSVSSNIVLIAWRRAGTEVNSPPIQSTRQASVPSLLNGAQIAARR
ncbi:hypothetical protein [Xanthomonas vasicola]|uniref:hypothetical protein n=1 Tax=Xanthomonas vasicola TaxID=56459 RepID=UPI001D0CBD4E|nr:hypothetical protein [Xanthomonas vasicola]